MLTPLPFLCLFSYVCSSTPFVKLKQGKLFGKDYTLQNGRVVNAYLGIPYAAPPVSDYRFKDPQKLNSWNGIWNATFARSDCLQTSFLGDTTIGDEDCLYLNIYTPKFRAGGKTALLDVFVYIHGGGFLWGSGNVLPDRFLETKNIVFVSINYRLGVFGFLSTNDDAASGNFGLKDQTASLQWIKKNIIHFGGNPTSITIAGISAGGASVHYHLISPLSKGLFQKALSFSGTVLQSWALHNDLKQKSNYIAALNECPHTNSTQMVQCLRKKPPAEICRAFTTITSGNMFPLIFGPSVEPENPRAFLSSKPIDILRKQIINDVPWLSTMVKDEGLFPAAVFMKSDSYLKKIDEEWKEIAPLILGYNYGLTEAEKQNISSSIKSFYFAEKTISSETIKILIQLLGDRLFFNGITEATTLHNLASRNKIYCLKFNYRGERSITNIFTNDLLDYGVSHGDDLQYYIKLHPEQNLKTESDLEVSRLMVSIIVDFLRSGNPNKVVNKWEPIAKDPNLDMNCLHIYSGNRMAMNYVPVNSSQQKFWKEILPFEH